MLSKGWDKKHILVLQSYIGLGTIHDSLEVDRENFLSAVGLHTAHNGTRGHGLFGKTRGCLDE